MLTRSLKRMLVRGGLAGMLAAAAFTTPAMGEVKGECLINADAKVVDKVDPTTGIRFVGSEGKFTFDTLAVTCLADSNKDLVPEVVSNVGLHATGWYSFSVCGTGKVVGTISQVTGGPWKFAILEGQKFSIEFLATAGVFKWHDWDKADVGVPKSPGSSSFPDKPDDDKPYTPAGAVLLGPAREKPFLTPEELLEESARGQCMKAFNINGSVAVDFDD